MARLEDRVPVRAGGGRLGAGVMLVMGLLAGIALAAAAGVFLLGIGWAVPLEARDIIRPTPSTSPAAAPSATPGIAAGAVPEPCARSARYNIEVDKGIDDLAMKVQSNDARAIQESLDRLQDARDAAAGAAEECLALAGSSATPQPSSARPSSAPPSSPTPSSPAPSSAQAGSPQPSASRTS